LIVYKTDYTHTNHSQHGFADDGLTCDLLKVLKLHNIELIYCKTKCVTTTQNETRSYDIAY